MIETLMDEAQDIARDKAEPMRQQAQESMHAALTAEIERLGHLQRLNGSIRDEEITYFQERLRQSEELIAQASVELQAV